MNTLKEFIKENRAAFNQEKLILEVTELLVTVMQQNSITKAELARRVGKSKAFITQCLSGEQNLTLRTLSDLFTAVDYCLEIGALPSAESTLKRMVRLYPVGAWAMEKCNVNDVSQHQGPLVESVPDFNVAAQLEAAA